MWAYHQYCQYCQYRQYDYNNYYNYRPRYTSPFFRMSPFKYTLQAVTVDVFLKVVDNGTNNASKYAKCCYLCWTPIPIALLSFKPRHQGSFIEKERHEENHAAEELAEEVLERERAEEFVHPH